MPFPPGAGEPAPWDTGHRLYGCVRDSLRALAGTGMETRGWRRVWVPAYFCQEGVRSLLSTGIEVALYPDLPTAPEPSFEGLGLRRGDVVFRVNFFGLRAMGPPRGVDRSLVAVIEDHTHDPWCGWAWRSDADWCVASLRKVFPVPDGGVLWSPVGHALPEAPLVTAHHRLGALEKTAAQLLKSQYLGGHAVDKGVFRALETSGEAALGSGPVSAMAEWSAALLPTFPAGAWRERRRANHRALSAALALVPGLRVLQAESGGDTCPFSVIVVFDGADQRAQVRERLIGSCVYPAVLWPLERPALPGIPDAAVDLSRRVLSIHCDARYDETAMRCVASLIRRALAEVPVPDAA